MLNKVEMQVNINTDYSQTSPAFATNKQNGSPSIEMEYGILIVEQIVRTGVSPAYIRQQILNTMTFSLGVGVASTIPASYRSENTWSDLKDEAAQLALGMIVDFVLQLPPDEYLALAMDASKKDKGTKKYMTIACLQ
jgi:hypothetical protein